MGDPGIAISSEDEEKEYEVAAIVGHKVTDGKVMVRVEWSGFHQKSWQPAESLQPGAEEILHTYLVNSCDGKSGSVEDLLKVLVDKPIKYTGAKRGRKRKSSMAANSTRPKSSKVSTSGEAMSDVNYSINHSVSYVRDTSSSCRSTPVSSRDSIENDNSTTVSSGESLKIIISDANSETQVMYAKRKHTIQKVKNGYSKARKIPYEDINFYFGGRLLDETETIGSAGVNHRDTIEMRISSLSQKSPLYCVQVDRMGDCSTSHAQAASNPDVNANSLDRSVIADKCGTIADPKMKDMLDNYLDRTKEPASELPALIEDAVKKHSIEMRPECEEDIACARAEEIIHTVGLDHCYTLTVSRSSSPKASGESAQMEEPPSSDHDTDVHLLDESIFADIRGPGIEDMQDGNHSGTNESQMEELPASNGQPVCNQNSNAVSLVYSFVPGRAIIVDTGMNDFESASLLEKKKSSEVFPSIGKVAEETKSAPNEPIVLGHFQEEESSSSLLLDDRAAGEVGSLLSQQPLDGIQLNELEGCPTSGVLARDNAQLLDRSSPEDFCDSIADSDLNAVGVSSIFENKESSEVIESVNAAEEHSKETHQEITDRMVLNLPEEEMIRSTEPIQSHAGADQVHETGNNVYLMDQSVADNREVASANIEMDDLGSTNLLEEKDSSEAVMMNENAAEERLEENSEIVGTVHTTIATATLDSPQELSRVGNRFCFHNAEVEENPNKKVKKIIKFEKIGTRLLLAKCECMDGNVEMFSYEELEWSYPKMLRNFVINLMLEQLE